MQLAMSDQYTDTTRKPEAREYRFQRWSLIDKPATGGDTVTAVQPQYVCIKVIYVQPLTVLAHHLC